MAIAEKIKSAAIRTTGKVPIPPEISPRLKRGRERMREDAPTRNECLAFWRGEQYRFVNAEGKLVSQPTTTSAFDRAGKPPHVVRRTRNLIFDIVEHEVASAVKRVPGYEVNATTSDPDDEAAARLSQQVARYGYDKWKVRRATESVVRFAIIADEGFVWPFFDTSVGPFMDDGEGGQIGQGEVRMRVFGPNEVIWEPGVDFDDSRWHAIEQARDIPETEAQEGYLGGSLSADAQRADQGGLRNKEGTKLVMVTEYLERPSAKHKDGRWLTFANDRTIVAERPYPCQDGKGKAVDEPVLHRLSYAVDPDSDRDMGLVRHLVDPNRAINNAVNKQIMWVDLAMNPQVILWNGGFAKGQRLTNQPGAAYQARGSGKVEWRPVPQMPSALAEMKNEAREDMAAIAAQNDIPSGVSSGTAIQSLLERDQTRRSNFTANLAEFHSRLMRHALYLVQRFYTEQRLIKIQGEFGADTIPEFRGAELLGQVDVTVLPGSLESLSRQENEARINSYAERGWITPQAAMAAIAGGNAEALVRSYEKDIARAHQIIRKIKAGPDTLFEVPPRIEFSQEVEGWLPRRFDNVDIQLSTFADWMKTVEFDALPEVMQQAAMTYYEALESLKAGKLAQQAEAQEIMAQSQGAANAAKPQAPIPSPQAAAEQIAEPPAGE